MTRFGARRRRSGDAETPRDRWGQADLAAAGLTLGFGALSHALLPERVRPWAGAGAALGLTALAHVVGADARDLGCDRRDLAAGVRVGAGAALAIVGVTAAARALDRSGTRFRDERVSGASTGDAAVQLLVRIPVATAFVEEMVFRGVILGLARRTGDRRRALVVSSVAFGLWHIGAAMHPARRDAVGAAVGRPGTTAPAIVGDVVATTVGGLGFGWLRLHSRSIVAPTLAHAALNASAYLATRFRSSAAR
jgi:membrane protease YdiL (CAAX protease family)